MLKRLFTAMLAVLFIMLFAGQILAGDPLTAKEKSWLKEHGTIEVGVFNDYPPFGFADERGRAAGLSIDYWQALAARLGLEVKFVPAPFKDQLEGLKNGRFDTLAGVFPLAERGQFFRFTPAYFTISTHIFAGPKLSGAKTLSDLAGLRVGAVEGDSGQVLAENAGLEVKAFVGYENAVLALGRKEVDAIVMDEPVVLYYRAKHGLQKEIIKAGPPVDEGRMTLPVRKDETTLYEILNKGASLVSAQEVEDMAKRWR